MQCVLLISQEQVPKLSDQRENSWKTFLSNTHMHIKHEKMIDKNLFKAANFESSLR